MGEGEKEGEIERKAKERSLATLATATSDISDTDYRNLEQQADIDDSTMALMQKQQESKRKKEERKI